MEPVALPDWLRRLRRTEVTDRVREDPRSVDDLLLGLEVGQAVDAIGRGRANFDAPCGDLSPDDLALLYAYLNQRGHLEELVAAFGQLLVGEQPADPIVVDVGCGPFTGGLALSATLGDDPCFDYVGIDHAGSMRRLAARLAGSDLVPGRVTTRWASDLDSVEWPRAPGFRDVIVIVSYLFGSPSLDAEAMFGGLDRLLHRLGGGAVTLLYTNSARKDANRRFPEFRARLEEAGLQVRVEGRGEIVVDRIDGRRERKLYYALCYRPTVRTLPLGG